MTDMSFMKPAPWILRLIGRALFCGVAIIAVLWVAWILFKTSINTLLAPLGFDLQSLALPPFPTWAMAAVGIVLVVSA